MRNMSSWILWVTIVLAALLLPTAGSAVVEGKAEDLAWLAGCWQSTKGEAGSGEQWSPPGGGTLLGTGRTIKDSQTVAVEFLMIRETDDGSLIYIAAPSGQNPTVFALAKLGDKEVIFANPAHDYPQVIAYRLREDGNLAARIEGPKDGKQVGLDFPMRRVSCTGK